MATMYLTARTLHVFLGAFWAGSVFFSVLFMDPAVREAGPEGGKVMGILQRRGWMTSVLWIGTTTVATGLYLLWTMSGHFSRGFMGSRTGILLSVGALAGMIILAIGLGVSRPTARRMGQVAAKVGAAQGPPAPEDLAELARLRARMTLLLRIVSALMVVAVVTMALAPHL